MQPLMQAAGVQPAQSLTDLLNQRLRKSLESQSQGIAGTQKQIAELQKKPERADLTNLLMMGDVLTGGRTNYGQMYKEHLAPKDNKAEIAKLQKLLAGQQDKLTGNEIDLLKLQIAGQKASGTGSKAASKFEEEKMKAFGKGAGAFYQKERPQLVANLPKIDEALTMMEEQPHLTGGIVDKVMGSTGLNLRDANAYKAQQNMQSAITDTLRPTLGAQFTENEGKRIMNLTFDPAVSTAENKRRASALKTVIETKVKFQDALYKHLSKYGTDSNFDYSKYKMAKAGAETSGGPVKGTVKGGYIFKGGDPSKPENWEKQ